MDDEDVVFENSPLERHLREVGFTDFEPEKPNNFYEEENLTTAVDGLSPTTETKIGLWFGEIWRYFTTKTSRIILSKVFSDFSERRLDIYCREYASIVLNSEVLCEEDLLFLQKFDPILFQGENTFEKEVNTRSNALIQLILNLYEVFQGSAYIVMAALTCLFAVCANFRNHFPDVFTVQSLFFFIFFTTIFSPLIWNIYKAFSMNWQHCANLSFLRNYCTETKLCFSLLRKSVMAIQEMELICSGYTFVGSGIPARVLQHKKDTSNTQEKIYPALRQKVFEVTRHIIACARNASNFMVKSFPLCPEINNTFNYLANVSLDVIYQDIEKVANGEAELYKQGNVSLHCLKVLCSVVAMLQSELLSRFVISLSNKSHNQASTTRMEIYHGLTNIFEGPFNELISFHQSLQRSYYLHKCSITEIEPTSKRRHRHNGEKPDKWSQFYDATHSLELHFQSALLKLASVRKNLDDIEKENDCNDATLSDCNDATPCEIEMSFSGIKINLESAISCWEEGRNQLEKISKKINPDITDELPTSMANSKQETLPDIKPICLNDKSVIEGVDQVFEGYTDSLTDYEYEEYGVSEDHKKEKRELEESRHLMVELRNVLAVKAKDPLVTSAGFVLPTEPPSAKKKEPICVFDMKLNSPDECSEKHKNCKQALHLHIENDSFNNTQGIGGAEPTTDKVDSDCLFEKSKANTGSLKKCDIDHHAQEGMAESLNLKSSFAFSIAAAAAARSQIVGVQEELFENEHK